jgi:hypothetical protein
MPAAGTGQKEKGRELKATALRLWKSPSRLNAKPRPVGRELGAARDGNLPDLRATAAEATQICFVSLTYLVDGSFHQRQVNQILRGRATTELRLAQWEEPEIKDCRPSRRWRASKSPV